MEWLIFQVSVGVALFAFAMISFRRIDREEAKRKAEEEGRAVPDDMPRSERLL